MLDIELGQEANRVVRGRCYSVDGASHGVCIRKNGGAHGRKHHAQGAR